MARRRGRATSRRPKTPPGHVQRDHRGRDPRRVRQPARHRPAPRRRAADAPHRRPPRRLHAQPAAVAQGPRRPVGRARAVGRRAPGRRARARDPRLHGPRVLDARGAARATPDGTRSPPTSSGSTASRSTSATSETAERHAAAHPPAAAGRRRRSRRASPSATRRRRSRPARSSRRRAASSASAPSGRCRIAQRLYEGVDTPDGHVGLITYMRTDSTAIAGGGDGRGAGGDQRRASASATAPARAASTRRRRRAPRRPTSRSGRRRSCATRSRCARHLKPEEYRLYRLIWQRAIASQMAPKELETTTVELVGGRLPPAGLGDPDAVRRLRRGSTPRARTTTPPRRPSARCRRCAEGDVTRVSRRSRPTQHFTEPPPRYTEATLIKALEEHGIGRPSTYAATISTIVDRGYVAGRGAAPAPRGDRRDRHRPAGRALRRVRGPRVHRAHGGGARRGRPRRARVGAAAARVLRAAQGARRREAQGAQARRLHDRGDRRGLLRGPPDGHPPRPQREVPRLLALPRAQGDAAAARRGGARSSRATARPARSAARASLATKRGRFGAFVGCSRYPDCTYIRKDGPPPPDQLPFEVTCPKNADGHLVARRARRTGNVFWGCSSYPQVRLHDQRRADRARSTTSTTDGKGAIARRGEAGLCLTCGATVELPDGRPGRACGCPVDRPTRRRSSGRRVAAAAAAGAAAPAAAGGPTRARRRAGARAGAGTRRTA